MREMGIKNKKYERKAKVLSLFFSFLKNRDNFFFRDKKGREITGQVNHTSFATWKEDCGPLRQRNVIIKNEFKFSLLLWHFYAINCVTHCGKIFYKGLDPLASNFTIFYGRKKSLV